MPIQSESHRKDTGGFHGESNEVISSSKALLRSLVFEVTSVRFPSPGWRR